MEHRRENRHLVTVTGRYRARLGKSRSIWIKDISEYGCRFFDRFSTIAVGSRILVKVGHIGPIPAEVKWREGSVVGAEFDHPIHAAVLGHITRFMDETDPDDEGEPEADGPR